MTKKEIIEHALKLQQGMFIYWSKTRRAKDNKSGFADKKMQNLYDALCDITKPKSLVR